MTRRAPRNHAKIVPRAGTAPSRGYSQHEGSRGVMAGIGDPVSSRCARPTTSGTRGRMAVSSRRARSTTGGGSADRHELRARPHQRTRRRDHDGRQGARGLRPRRIPRSSGSRVAAGEACQRETVAVRRDVRQDDVGSRDRARLRHPPRQRGPPPVAPHVRRAFADQGHRLAQRAQSVRHYRTARPRDLTPGARPPDRRGRRSARSPARQGRAPRTRRS